MAQAGNTTGAGGPKNLARATRKVTPVKASAPLSATPVPTAKLKKAPTPKLVVVPRKMGTAPPLAKGPVSTQRAANIHEVRRQRAEELAHAQAAHDILTAGDKAKADTFNAKHPVKAPASTKGTTGPLAFVDNALSGKLTQGAVHAAEDVAGKAAPILAAAAVGPLAAAGDYAVGKATGLGKPAGKLIRNAAKDLVDIPANAIPSLYGPGKQAVSGDVKGAAKSLAQPFIDAAKDPGKAIMDHPVGTALLFRGGEGAIGHGAGRILRAAPSETLRKVGSTERASKTLPGARVEQQRSYSKDVIEKGAQVLGEKRAAKRAVKRGQSPQPRMSAKDIQRRVDEEVQAAKIIAQQHAGQTQKAAKKAVGKKATAATNLTAQGATDHTHADLHAYLIELERDAHTLTGDKLKANEVAQQHIHDALKNHNEAQVAQSAAAYAEHRAPLEQQVVDLGLVKPDVAEATRLAPVAVRRFGASAEMKAAAFAAAKEQAKLAKRGTNQAKKVVVKADKQMAQARANARVSVARRKQSPALREAETQRTQAAAAAALLKQQTAKDTAKASVTADTQLARAVQKARVSVKIGPPSAGLKAAEAARREAVAEAARAKRAHDQARDALGVAHGRAQVLTRNIGGGGKGGGYGIELGSRALQAAGERVKATRAAVREADRAVAAEQARARGVAPAQHDALLRAIAAKDEAMAAARRGAPEATARAREAVRAADAAVATERARIRGVAPDEHQALLKSLGDKDQARAALALKRELSKTAKAEKLAVKKAPFVSAQGKPLDLAAVRGALSPTASEPVFVSHEHGGGKPASLPTARLSIPTKEQRTGAAVRQGTLDVRPQVLVDQSVRTQGLIDATHARNRFLDDFGYRTGKNPERYGTQKIAENAAPAAQELTGVKWSAMQHQDGDWVLVPKDAKARLAQHEEKVAQHPLVKAVGAQWRRNVLAFSPRWLTGNTVEAAVRSIVAGAGPRSYITAKRSIKALERTDPAAAEQLKARALGGGQYRTAERVAHDPMGEDLGRFALAARKLRQTHGPKELADAYGAYTKTVFNSLNGRIETQFQTAMLGKALRDSPLMSKHTLKMSQAAAEDAARGLQNTNAQVAFGREVDRMYGQYQKFSPGLRAQIATYTPFISWTLNAAKFLYVTLPHDHPVLTSLIASANQASDGWRKQHGLVADYFHAAKTPGWLQGSIPGADGSHLRVSRYTPFGLLTNEGNSPLGSAASLLLPQFSEITANLGGKNWQGKSLSASGTPSGARDDIAAIVSFLEGQVPAASQVLNVAGVRRPNMADRTQVKPGVGLRARAQFDPFMYTQGSSTPASSGPLKPPPPPSAGGKKVRLIAAPPPPPR